MSSHPVLQSILWIAPAAVQIAIVVAMLRNGSRKRFPAFCTYTIFQILLSVVLVFFYRMGELDYFFAYWAGAAMSAFLGFGVIYECFSEALKPYDTLRDLGRLLFRWTAIVMVLVGVVFALSAPGGTESTVLVRNILVLERAIRIMQCGMLLLLYLFSHHVGISWRNQLFGVVLGFGIYASANLLMYSLRSRLGEDWNTSASILNALSYLVVTGIWAGYMWAPAAERTLVRSEAPLILERWNTELAAINNPRPVQGAFLPGLEDVVSRVMTRGAGPAGLD
jgi:hypothetical protein